MAPQTIQLLAVALVFGGFAVAEWRMGRIWDDRADADDHWLDLAGTLAFPVMSLTVLGLSQRLMGWALPEARGAWGDWPVLAMLTCFFLADDLTQYLWHRLCHNSRLWVLHRPHHSAPYVNVQVAFRNNAFYYLTLPGLWLSGALVYLGLGWVYVVYTSLKLTVIISAHSAVRWDAWLIEQRRCRPVVWVLERLISTPATHCAHHALTERDGVGRHQGNYGNLLFIWDVLFNTAHFPRRYPSAYGLPEDRAHDDPRWWVQWLAPLWRKTGKVPRIESTLPECAQLAASEVAPPR